MVNLGALGESYTVGKAKMRIGYWGKRVVSGVVVAVLLASCAGTASRTPSGNGTSTNYKIGSPYQVAGVWYYPKEQSKYNETGLASWYGSKFHGKKTANGEIYDRFAMTAAHKTLPMPVKVRVTNLANGRQVILRVNDRGPFVAGRIIDVSEKAAGLLGFKGHGTAKVRVEYLGRMDQEFFIAEKPITAKDERKVPTAAPVRDVASASLLPLPGVETAPSYESNRPTIPDAEEGLGAEVSTVAVMIGSELFIQTGSFQVRDNALMQKTRLMQQGYPETEVRIRPTSVEGIEYYRVQIGPLASVTQADHRLSQVLSDGHAGARIVIDG